MSEERRMLLEVLRRARKAVRPAPVPSPDLQPDALARELDIIRTNLDSQERDRLNVVGFVVLQAAHDGLARAGRAIRELGRIYGKPMEVPGGR
jgi:hypothetical protein